MSQIARIVRPLVLYLTVAVIDFIVGALVIYQGERGLLKFPPSWLLRLRYNPFYDFLENRVTEWMDEALYFLLFKFLSRKQRSGRARKPRSRHTSIPLAWAP